MLAVPTICGRGGGCQSVAIYDGLTSAKPRRPSVPLAPDARRRAGAAARPRARGGAQSRPSAMGSLVGRDAPPPSRPVVDDLLYQRIGGPIEVFERDRKTTLGSVVHEVVRARLTIVRPEE